MHSLLVLTVAVFAIQTPAEEVLHGSLSHLVPQQMNLHPQPKMFPHHNSIRSHCKHLPLLLNLADRITCVGLSLPLLCDFAGSGEHTVV